MAWPLVADLFGEPTRRTCTPQPCIDPLCGRIRVPGLPCRSCKRLLAYPCYQLPCVLRHLFPISCTGAFLVCFASRGNNGICQGINTHPPHSCVHTHKHTHARMHACTPLCLHTHCMSQPQRTAASACLRPELNMACRGLLQVTCLAWDRHGKYLATTDGAEAAVW